MLPQWMSHVFRPLHHPITHQHPSHCVSNGMEWLLTKPMSLSWPSWHPAPACPGYSCISNQNPNPHILQTKTEMHCCTVQWLSGDLLQVIQSVNCNNCSNYTQTVLSTHQDFSRNSYYLHLLSCDWSASCHNSEQQSIIIIFTEGERERETGSI